MSESTQTNATTIGLILVAQGMQALQEYTTKVANGTVTDADNQAMSDKLGLDIAALEAHAQAAKAEGR